MSDDAPRHPLLAARALLDDALVGLRAIADPAVAARDAEAALASALVEVYGALADYADHVAWDAAMARAREHLGASLEALQRAPSVDPAVGAALDRVAGVLRLLGRPAGLPVGALLDLPRRDPGLTVRATVGVPALVEMSRRVLRPAVPLPAPEEGDAAPPTEDVAPAAVTDAAGLAAQRAAAEAALAVFEAESEAPAIEPSPAPAPAPAVEPEPTLFGAALRYDEVVHERARGCFEDLAAMGAMRRPTPDEAWWCPRTEERLLARVDALVSCGIEALPPLVKLMEERPLPDPELTWAGIFLFGSIAGDDALHEVERLVRSAPLAADRMAPAVADALAHAPHPGLNPLLQPWLHHADGAWRFVALTALARRRALPPDALLSLVDDPEATVRRAAAEALATVEPAPEAGLFARALRDADDGVVARALRAAVLRRRPVALERAAELLETANEREVGAAMVLALAAGEAGFGRLMRAAQRESRAATVDALGWYGHLGAARFLIAQMEGDDADVARAAAQALWRLTGAGLTDDDPEPAYRDDDPPWTESFREPRRVPLLSEDAAVWARWWDRHGSGADVTRRHRFGHPWSPWDDLWEWSDRASSPTCRARCHLEMVARTEAALPFDAEDFIPRQEAQLAAWRRYVEAHPERAVGGRWVTVLGEGALRP